MMPPLDPPAVFKRRSTKAMIVAVFTALALATNYALSGVYNVKVMDALVFIVAFLFGVRLGIGVGTSIWLVWGFVNPSGVDDLITFSFVVVGESFYVLAGAILRRTSIAQSLLQRGGSSFRQLGLVFALVGLLSTFSYDVFTNFGSWLFLTSSSYEAFVRGNIIGAPFSVAHEASNTVFFATVAPTIIVSIRRLGFGSFQEEGEPET